MMPCSIDPLIEIRPYTLVAVILSEATGEVSITSKTVSAPETPLRQIGRAVRLPGLLTRI